jgi:uncharacterized repeat protein (TIGR01451 family)
MFNHIRSLRISTAMRWLVSAALVALLAPAAPIYLARAATLTVTNANDSGVGSLRQAIADAAPGNTLTFAPQVSGTLALTSGELVLSKDVTIAGPGVDVLTISGNNTSRVISITAGVVVTLTGLTVANGRTSDDGAGIYNSGTLTLLNASIYNNVGTSGGDYGISRGGGLYNAGGAATLTNVQVYSNAADYFGNYATGPGSGGGIYNAGGTMTLNASAVYSNASEFGGTGISNDAGTLVLSQSLVHHNSVQGINNYYWRGSEIYSTGILTMTNSQIYGSYDTGLLIEEQGQAALTAVAVYDNYTVGIVVYAGSVLTLINSSVYANGYYGQIESSDSTLALTNTTLSGNSNGPGLQATNSNLTLNNVTVVGNSTGVTINGGSAKISNSILNNIYNDCWGTALSGGYNIESRTDCGLAGIGDLQNTTPLLGPLTDNGGGMLTYAPLPGSPAIDAGNPDTPGSGGDTCAATDQRGVARPQRGRCDIGAVEALDAPDVRITKSVASPEARPGQVVTYTLNFDNVGLVDATGVVITDSVPNSITNPSFVSSGASITPVGGTAYVWQAGTLAPGVTGVITLTGTLSPTLASELTFANTATIATAADEPATVQSNNTSSVSVAARLPRLSMTVDDWVYKTAGSAVVTVTLDTPPAATITVDYATGDDTAVAGTDYVATSGILTFAPGVVQQTIPVTILNNPSNTTGRDFTVTLSNPVRAVISTDSVPVLVVPGFTRIVTNHADSGPGSLRQTVAEAVAGDTLTFAPNITGTIELVEDELVIDKGLTIIGPGADKLALSGLYAHRVLSVSIKSNVTISGLSFTYGFLSDGNGAGIYNAGNLTLLRCSIHDNVIIPGYYYDPVFTSGLYNDDGQVRLIDTEVHHNQTRVTFDPNTDAGATIHNHGGTLTLINSQVYANRGGGLSGSNVRDQHYAVALTSTIWMTGTVVYDNSGAGVVHEGFLTIANSSLYDNQGYGIWWAGGRSDGENMSLSLVNTTLSGNQQAGLFHTGVGVATLSNVTIANNRGYGIGSYYDYSIYGHPAQVSNSILVGNQTGNCYWDSKVNSLGYNLIDDNTCGLNATGDLTNTNPLLGPLADNGGGTLTHLPLLGSPAIDAGDSATCPTTDQRGVARPQAGGCDIGAVEVSASADLMVSLGAEQAKARPGQPLTYTLKFRNLGLPSAPGVVLTNIVPSFLNNVNVTSSGAAITPLGGPAYAWQVADLPLGAGGTITVTGIVNPALTLGATFTNTVTIATTASELDVTNNTDSASVTVSPPQARFAGDYIVPKDIGVLTASVTLDVVSALTITVDYATQDGTALAGTDYLTATGTLTFVPGVTEQSIPLTILNDAGNTSGRTFSMVLSNPSNAEIDPRPALVLIVPQIFRLTMPLIMR